jgi:putative transposase
MTNHVHLVIDSGENVKSLGLLMKRIAARHTRLVNRREGRSGTLWESRFRSSPIDSERYLLACCRYVEMNPVRAGIAAAPGDYPWSSYRSRSGLAQARFVDALPSEAKLDALPGCADAADRYRAWVNSPVPPGEWDLLRKAVTRGQLSGDERFIDEVSQRIGCRVESRGPGNPRKPVKRESTPPWRPDSSSPDFGK